MRNRRIPSAWFYGTGFLLLLLAGFLAYADLQYRLCIYDNVYEPSHLFTPREEIERVCFRRHILRTK